MSLFNIIPLNAFKNTKLQCWRLLNILKIDIIYLKIPGIKNNNFLIFQTFTSTYKNNQNLTIDNIFVTILDIKNGVNIYYKAYSMT